MLRAVYPRCVLEGTMMRVISVVRLLKGIWRRRLLPSGMCGWLAVARSYWRGAVSNLTRRNPQTPTQTASCDENQFTGEINSVWIVEELSSPAWSCCLSFFSHPRVVVDRLVSLWTLLWLVLTNLPEILEPMKQGFIFPRGRNVQENDAGRRCIVTASDFVLKMHG